MDSMTPEQNMARHRINNLAVIYRTDQRFSYSNPGRMYVPAPRHDQIGLLGYVDVIEWGPERYARVELGRRFWNRNSPWRTPVWHPVDMSVVNFGTMTYRWRRAPRRPGR